MFNNELYRIIGIMNNIEDTNCNIGSRIKVIKEEVFGRYRYSDTVNINYTNSNVKNVLNSGEYYQTLSNESISLIDHIVWKNGVIDTSWRFYTANGRKIEVINNKFEPDSDVIIKAKFKKFDIKSEVIGEKKAEKNPKTYDSIKYYITLLLISINVIIFIIKKCKRINS